MKRVIAAIVFGAFAAGMAHAQVPRSGDDRMAHHEAAKADAALTDGEVRRVDNDAQKVTIKHAPMPDLGMPAMTMVFRVKDPALLQGVKTGDRIRFRAEKVQGAYTVTEMQPAK